MTYNRYFAALLKLPPMPESSEALPMMKIDVTDFMPMASRAEFLSTLHRLEGRFEGAAPDSLELAMEIEGRPAWFRLTLSWIPDSLQVCLCAVDITEERNFQKRVLQQEKDILLDSLLGGVAHELNNKALPLLGFSELLSAEAASGGSPENIARYTQIIKKSTDEFAAVVHQLLQLVKPGGGKLAAVDLRAVVRQALSLVSFQLGDARIAVAAAFSEAAASILADPNQVKQIVLNLLLNAIEAMKETPRRELLLRIDVADSKVRLELRDTGVGIAPEVLPRIFDPFFTTKSAETARGLGLSVGRSLARQDKGEITVESEVGKGSVFTLHFPYYPLQAAVSLPPATVSPVPSAALSALPATLPSAVRTNRILVADDEENVGNLVREILRRKLSGTIERVYNGEEAIARIEAHTAAQAANGSGAEPAFDLIVSDVRMPVKNGLELFRWIAANRPALVPRFLFITGHDGSNDMSDEIARSGVPVLRKPFTADTLVQTCQERLAAVSGE